MIASLVRDNMKKILRFTASWCQPCKALAKHLEAAELDIPIEVVDIDVHEQVAIDYSVRNVPTLVLLNDDVEVKRITGVKTFKELKDWAEND